MSQYTIATDDGSQTIEATSADEAARIFSGGHQETSEELREAIAEAGGYGHMSENGIDLWRIGA